MLLGFLAVCIIVFLAVVQTVFYGGLYAVDRVVHLSKRKKYYATPESAQKTREECQRVIADLQRLSGNRPRS